ncbi:DUF3375 domain-containing protein [Sanguibacter sp. HDW7]|uniref:DUF3375 domain-containing protein n=1 Tax=Sanguibacter sp. HDW7 TaxID=2714931 RepID=UPI001408C558|nr:DUF3375 domain-containing protein [Sanguibacter sp. HDW7]QIK83827.1 DUF3375 domain-containing protein [Sanguibacter sp. HDW7]
MTGQPLEGVGGTLAAVQRTFASPTLALLHKQSAPFVVAVFESVFVAGRSAVGADAMHLEVAQLLADLRAAGVEGVPGEAARVLCSRWVRERWLIRDVDDATGEQYRLTSSAQEALEFVRRAGGARALVSESRIRTLLDAVERAAHDANPDRGARLATLDQQIERLTAERDRLAGGGAVAQTSADRMEEQVDHVLMLVRELPSDFARVAESIKALQRSIIGQLRADERPTGEVLEEYLTASENLMENTPEGRAFLGAMELLGDPELVAALDAHLAAVLRHPFAQHVDRSQRTAFRSIRSQVVEALEVVQTEQARATRTLTAQVRQRDPLRDRELDHAIRDAVNALTEWFPAAGRGARVEPLTWLGRARLGRLRTTLHDLRPEAPPAALAHAAPDDLPATDLAEIRAMGGPQTGLLAEHVTVLTSDGSRVSVADAFARGGAALRRPVELLGYYELAADDLGAGDDAADGSRDDAAVERVTAVRADGSTRDFLVPRVMLAATTDPADGGIS